MNVNVNNTGATDSHNAYFLVFTKNERGFIKQDSNM